MNLQMNESVLANLRFWRAGIIHCTKPISRMVSRGRENGELLFNLYICIFNLYRVLVLQHENS